MLNKESLSQSNSTPVDTDLYNFEGASSNGKSGSCLRFL